MLNLAKKFYSQIKSFFVPEIDYQLNDPTTPVLMKKVAIPPLPQPCPTFAVHGWNGLGAQQGTIEWQAAEVYITIVNSITLANRLLEIPVGNWSGTQNLIAYPRAGKAFNAFYDRLGLKFYWNIHPTTGKPVYTCESADVVSHELWHGILDSLRPDIWNVQALEIFAFHESFGDMGSILTALSHDEVIDYVIRETGGNLKHSNVVSRLAEEMGSAIAAMQHGRSADALRNAVNDFQYIAPETLPHLGGDDQLCCECHNFSRVFTGAFYDMLCILYQKHVQVMSPMDALRTSRDEAGRTVLNAARIAAVTPRFFSSMVRAMLMWDQGHGSPCHDAIMTAFTARRIFSEIPMTTKPTAMKMNYQKDCKIYSHDGGSAIRIGGVKQIKLTDQMVLEQKNNTNPLYSISIDIPNDHYLEYDSHNKLRLEIPNDKNNVLTSARYCLDYLNATDRVSYEGEEEKEFHVVNNRLVRNRICCCKDKSRKV